MKTAIAIKSCHKYADRRQAQRDTWLKGVDTDFFFVIGDPEPLTESDLLYLPGRSDAFTDIAPKVLGAVEYALEENVTNLLVCDDDTYISWPRMKESGFERFSYLGFVRNHGPYAYMQGSCFWLDEQSMATLANLKEYMACRTPDDVAVGRCLTGVVPFTHEHRYQVGSPYPEPTQWPRKDNDIIACHKMNFMQMHTCHERLVTSA